MVEDGKRAALEERLASMGRFTSTALASLLPGGGVLAAALGELYNLEGGKRVLGVIAEVEKALGARVARLEQREEEYILRLAMEARLATDVEQLVRLRNAATNAVLLNIEDAWFGALQECVARLRTEEVTVLVTVRQAIHPNRQNHMMTGIKDLQHCLPTLPPDLLLTIVRRLDRLGLVENDKMSEGPGEYTVMNMTKLGLRFLDFIREPAKPA